MSKDTDHIFNASACGDNCAGWILKIADMHRTKGKDLKIRLGYLMNFGEGPFDIEIGNIGLIVHNIRDLTEAVLDHELLS